MLLIWLMFFVMWATMPVWPMHTLTLVCIRLTGHIACFRLCNRPPDLCQCHMQTARASGSKAIATGSIAAGGAAGTSEAAAAGPDPQAALVESLQGQVETLKKEVKQLQAENQNMFWLADEYKRLKAELAALKGGGQQ